MTLASHGHPIIWWPGRSRWHRKSGLTREKRVTARPLSGREIEVIFPEEFVMVAEIGIECRKSNVTGKKDMFLASLSNIQNCLNAAVKSLTKESDEIRWLNSDILQLYILTINLLNPVQLLSIWSVWNMPAACGVVWALNGVVAWHDHFWPGRCLD